MSKENLDEILEFAKRISRNLTESIKNKPKEVPIAIKSDDELINNNSKGS